MDDKLFNELTTSVSEAKKIDSGELKTAKRIKYSPVNIKEIRAKLHCSQREFANVIGVSCSTIQNWEQGRRIPRGPARALLQIVSKEPQLVKSTLNI